ncbi:MAG: hypothetical protein K2X59_03280 [Sphingomonas sp.]|nr:hypothetical protein [Sphingomonas sp.]
MLVRSSLSKAFGPILAGGLFAAAFTASSALAAGPQPDPAQPSLADPAPTPTPPADPRLADKQRYCTINDITGSHIPRKFCRTRAEWAEMGVDVDHPNKN